LEHFYYISDLGKISLFDESQISKLNVLNDEHALLVLDSCVCFDIINLIEMKEESISDKEKIFSLIEYAQINNVRHFSLFALLESCYDRNTLEIQTDKFNEFRNVIDFAFQHPVARLKKFDYDYNTDYNDLSLKTEYKRDLIKSLTEEMLNPSYAAMLKICELSKKGLSAGWAEKNITDFLDWMENELNIILGVDYSFALEIFGGNSKFRKMIKLDASKKRIIPAARGAAWDMFHAKMSRNKKQLSYISGYKVYPVFVTKDQVLAELISPKVNSYEKLGRSLVSRVQRNSKLNYSEDFWNYLNERLLKIKTERIGRNSSVDREKVKSIINVLEDNLND
jgi:hypothetical protein